MLHTINIPAINNQIYPRGNGGSLRSCDALLKRVENNDPKLTELVILPMKVFGPSDLERLSTAIASGANTNLHAISASGHHLPPESLKQFAIALSTQANNSSQQNNNCERCGITSLAIGSKDLSDVGVIALCEGLEGSNGGLLRVVDFGWKNIGKSGVHSIGKTFASSSFLRQLDLSRNSSVGDEGIQSFAIAATKSAGISAPSFPSLETLVLSECNIGPTGMLSLSDLVLGRQNNRITPIDLSIKSNPIGPRGCKELSKLCAIPGRGSVLSQLHLPQCSIGNKGIQLLSTAASVNPCFGLKVLDLSENSITSDGASSLAASLLNSWPTLVELNLSKNELESEGVASILGALVSRDGAIKSDSAKERNSTLKILDLSCTSCGIEGAKAALRSSGLATLRLFNNKLGSVGFHSIATLLQGGHPSIENLDLGGNNADEVSVVAVLNAIAYKMENGPASKLSVLEIGGNMFGDEAQVALEKLRQVWPLLDVAHDKPVREEY